MQELTISVERRHPLVQFVGHVKTFLSIEVHADRPAELGVSGAGTVPELVQVVLVQVADTDANCLGPRRIATVEHEDAAITADCQIVRVGETAPVQPVVDDSDCLYVVQRNAG